MNLGLAQDTGDWLDADSVKSKLLSSQDRQIHIMQELLGSPFKREGKGWAWVDPDSLKGTPSEKNPEHLLFLDSAGSPGQTDQAMSLNGLKATLVTTISRH